MPRKALSTHTTPETGTYRPSSGARDRLQKARGVPASWLLSQAREKRIPHHKLGHYVRFDIDALIQWLDQTRVDPTPRHRPR